MKNDKYQKLRDVLDQNPSDGPWHMKRHTSGLDGVHTMTDDWTVYAANGNAICFEGQEPALADPEYIAAANPATIRALLAELDAKTAALKEIAEMGYHGAFAMPTRPINVAVEALRGDQS